MAIAIPESALNVKKKQALCPLGAGGSRARPIFLAKDAPLIYPCAGKGT